MEFLAESFQLSTNPIFEHDAIAIARTLRISPPLLHGFNSLLKKGYRVEFSNKVEVVDLLVWATPTAATIRSFSGSNVPSPGCAAELRVLLSSDQELEDLLRLDHGKYGDEYLTCLSQLLQFVSCHYVLRRLLADIRLDHGRHCHGCGSCNSFSM